MRKLNPEEQKLYEELRAKVAEYAETVDVLPFSHNLVSMGLREIAQKFGKEFSDQVIDDLDLEELGYHKSTKV